MKIKEVIEEGKSLLNKSGFEDSGIIARELLCHVLNKSKQYLVINMDEEVEEKNYQNFIDNINEIIDGKPLQYITKKQEFMGLEFYVDENVLIPQPDTEILVESVLDICNNMADKKTNIDILVESVLDICNNIKTKKIKILDLCTGSGAIAISLASALKNNNIEAEIFASDISEKALEIAKKNNKSNNTNVKFIDSDLFTNIHDNNFDIIVSNPPYIKKRVINTLSKQVQSEPIIALDGGDDGLYFYKKIAEQAIKFINNNGFLCLEIGYDQKKEVVDLLKKHKEYAEINAIQDLSNNDRCIIARVIENS